MSYWTFSQPDDLRSLERASAKNGKLVFPYRMPILHDCPECGSGGGLGKLIPIQCPDEVRNILESTFGADEFWLASYDEYARLVHQIQDYFPGRKLQPGSEFLPANWHVAVPPEGNVYWPVMNLVMHANLTTRLLDASVTGLKFFPIEVARMGSLNINMELWPDELVSVGEDEMMDAARPYLTPTDELDDFFLIEAETTVYTQIAFEFEWTHCSICNGLKNKPNYDGYGKLVDLWRDHGVMPERLVPNLDVFHCPGLGDLVISDRVRNVLRKYNVDNYVSRPVRLIDDNGKVI